MLFLGIILWKGASGFNKGFVFQMGQGFIFKWEVCSMGGGASVLTGGVRKKSKDAGGIHGLSFCLRTSLSYPSINNITTCYIT